MPPVALPIHVIDAELAALEAALLEAGGELTPEMEAAYEDLLAMRAEKITGYVAVIRRLALSGDAYKAEAERLAGHARTCARSADTLKERLLVALLSRGEQSYETPLGRLRVQHAASQAVTLRCNSEALPERFRSVTYTPDKRALADALRAGDPEAEAVAAFSYPAPFLRIY